MVFLGSPRFFSPLFSSTLDLTRWELATLRWREHSVRLEPCKSGIYYSHVSQTVNGSSKHQKARSPSGRVAPTLRFFSAPRVFVSRRGLQRLIGHHLNGIFSLSPRLFRERITRAFAENDPLIEKVEPCAQSQTYYWSLLCVDVRKHVSSRGARSRGSIFDHGRFLTFSPLLRCAIRLVHVRSVIVMVIDACWYRWFRIPHPLGELCVSRVVTL